MTTGTGGVAGWPEPGCRCASCARAAAAGIARKPSGIVVDGRLRLRLGGQPEGDGPEVARVAGGWEVTGADGTRLLYPAAPGSVLSPPAGAAPYDIVFADVLGDPFQLGLLRARGLAGPGTSVLAACCDHRVPSLADLEERCAFWDAVVPADSRPVRRRRCDHGGERGERRVLVLGGARSGKSERAELRVAAEPAVSYVATGPDGTADPDWARRVAAHRARRPSWWRTIETTDLAGVLRASHDGVLLIDGIGTWLAAAMLAGDVAAQVGELVAAWRQTPNRVAAVSDEAGLGVIPVTEPGRTFRDWLGRVNQSLASESEVVELVVTGRVLRL